MQRVLEHKKADKLALYFKYILLSSVYVCMYLLPCGQEFKKKKKSKESGILEFSVLFLHWGVNFQLCLSDRGRHVLRTKWESWKKEESDNTMFWNFFIISSTLLRDSKIYIHITCFRKEQEWKKYLVARRMLGLVWLKKIIYRATYSNIRYWKYSK